MAVVRGGGGQACGPSRAMRLSSRQAFPGEPEPVTAANFALAVGAFERTLVTPAPFDAVRRRRHQGPDGPARRPDLRDFHRYGLCRLSRRALLRRTVLREVRRSRALRDLHQERGDRRRPVRRDEKGGRQVLFQSARSPQRRDDRRPTFMTVRSAACGRRPDHGQGPDRDGTRRGEGRGDHSVPPGTDRGRSRRMCWKCPSCRRGRCGRSSRSAAPIPGGAADLSPNEDLMQEHALLERVLLIYEEVARRLQGGDRPTRRFSGRRPHHPAFSSSSTTRSSRRSTFSPASTKPVRSGFGQRS